MFPAASWPLPVGTALKGEQPSCGELICDKKQNIKENH
jgi:hypothetical protein